VGGDSPVLIVDDDADLLRALSGVLEDAGYRVVVALDGRQALSLLERGLEPALVLLDLMMPRMNGWQVLDEIGRARHASGRRIPIVLMSALEGSMQTLSWRVEGTLQKPVASAALLGLVGRFVPARSALDSSSSTAELWGEPASVPAQLAARLAVTVGHGTAGTIIDECLASANLSTTRNPEELLSFAYELIVRGGIVALFGRSLKVHALRLGAKFSS
jgi:CheY-like chemotaxis protein